MNDLADEFEENGLPDVAEYLREHGAGATWEWLSEQAAEAKANDDPEGWRLGNLEVARGRLGAEFVEVAEGERVQVHYEVKVSAFVDVEAGRIDKVVVWDEDIGQPIEAPTTESYTGPIRPEIAKRAEDIAEGMTETVADWPSWQVGP